LGLRGLRDCVMPQVMEPQPSERARYIFDIAFADWIAARRSGSL
jgi:hypothetical protein